MRPIREVIAGRVVFPKRHVIIEHEYFPPYQETFPSLNDLEFIKTLHGPPPPIGYLNAHHRDLGDPSGNSNCRGEAISDFLLHSDFQITTEPPSLLGLHSSPSDLHLQDQIISYT